MRLWWVSWNQLADPKYGIDSRPVKWPPPKSVIAFWESGFAADESCSQVVALVDAETETEVKATIEKAWTPGVGSWRFARTYEGTKPPGDRFPAPDWSIDLGRWPWREKRRGYRPA